MRSRSPPSFGPSSLPTNLYVEHRGSDHAYPILLDPQVIDRYAWRADPAAPFAGWFNSANVAGALAYHAGDGYRGRGLYVFGKSSYNFYPHPTTPRPTSGARGASGTSRRRAPPTSTLPSTAT